MSKEIIDVIENNDNFKELLKLEQEELHEYLCEILPSYYEEDKIIGKMLKE